MGLSKKVLLLWNARTFAISTLLFPPLESFGAGRLWAGITLLLFLLFFWLFFFIRYKSCVLEITSQDIKVHTGILIRKTLYIKYCHAIAVNKICSPLSAHLEVSNPVIYCEGATFLLPPLENSLTEQIENYIKAEVNKYEL